MKKKLRMDLIDEYYHLYRARNARVHGASFRQTYVHISELWDDFSPEEQHAVNIRFIQDNLAL